MQNIKLFGESARCFNDNAYPVIMVFISILLMKLIKIQEQLIPTKSSCAGIVSKVNDSQHYCLDCKAAENGYYAPMYTAAAQMAEEETNFFN